MDIDYNTIGRRIKELRTKESLTQEKLAELCSLSIQHISNIENGRTKLALPALVNIANVLNTTVDFLLDSNLTSADSVYEYELYQLMNECDEKERKVILETVRGLKKSLENNYKKHR